MFGNWESSRCFLEAIVVHRKLSRGAIFGRAGEEDGWMPAVDNASAIPLPNSDGGVRGFCACGVRVAFFMHSGGPV